MAHYVGVSSVSLLLAVTFAAVDSKDRFYCFGDICNSGTADQFCSSTFKMCRDCNDVRDDCGGKDQPKNCSLFCGKYLAGLELKSKEEMGCSGLPVLDDIVINGTNSMIIEPVTKGTEVTVECKPGFKLSYPNKLTCGKFGEWDLTKPFCKAITCPPPGDLEHGRQTLQVRVNGFNYKDVVNYECDEGYTISGPSTIECSEDGLWHPVGDIRGPVCIKAEEFVTTCKVLPFIYNGAWSNDSDVFELGQSISAVCKTGFTLVGSKTWTCTETGWSSCGKENVMPSCFQTSDDNWFIAFISVSTVLAAGCFALTIYVVLVRKCGQHHHTSDRSNHVIAEDTEQQTHLLHEHEQEEQSNRGSVRCDENAKENANSELSAKTTTLHSGTKPLQLVTGSRVKNNRIKSELLTCKTALNINTGRNNILGPVIKNSNKIIDDVNASNRCTPPDIVIGIDANGQDQGKPQTDEKLVVPQHCDTKQFEYRSGTCEHRQPKDTRPLPEIGQSGISSTYHNTLNLHSILKEPTETFRDSSNHNDIQKLSKNLNDVLQNGVNGQNATKKDTEKESFSGNSTAKTNNPNVSENVINEINRMP